MAEHEPEQAPARPMHSSGRGSLDVEAESLDAQQTEEVRRTPLAAWVIAALGFVLVVGAVGFLVYRGVEANTPPDITLSVESVEPTRAGFLVTFRAYNAGGRAAAGVGVQGELRARGAGADAAPMATSTATISYAPSRSWRRGGLFFEEDPRRLVLTLRAVGYEAP